MSAEVKFIEELPQNVSPRYAKWRPIVDQLKERPGVWAEIARAARTNAGAVGSGYQRLSYYGCECRRLKDESGEVVLYARWPA